MNKFTLLSLVVATFIFTACGEDAKKAVTDAATSATETVTDAASKAVDATKEAAEKAAEAAKNKAAEVAEAAADKAAEAATALKERAATATETVKDAATATTAAAGAAVTSAKEAVTPDNAAGKAAYAKCAGCHGVDGKTKALGKSAEVAGQAVATLVDAINGYKAGTRNVSGMGMLMKGQVASMDDATITAVSEYMSGL